MITSRIISTGSALPSAVATNDYLSTIVETSDEWIRTRTGIKERRIVTTEDTTSLAIHAGRAALDASGLSAQALDLILVATLTPTQFMPNTACSVQAALGATSAVCFDINAACSGFIFALQTAHAHIVSGLSRYALVIGAESLSKAVDWKDRSTCVLFGDGAGAAILGADSNGILQNLSGSDGSKGSILTYGGPPFKNPFITKETNSPYISMNGQEVFKFAVRKIPELIIELTQKEGIPVSDLQCILLHQANERIIQAAAKHLSLPIDLFPMNLDRYGNTSAASLAILLDEVNQEKKLERGKPLILAGFGGGMTWGSILMNW